MAVFIFQSFIGIKCTAVLANFLLNTQILSYFWAGKLA